MIDKSMIMSGVFALTLTGTIGLLLIKKSVKLSIFFYGLCVLIALPITTGMTVFYILEKHSLMVDYLLPVSVFSAVLVFVGFLYYFPLIIRETIKESKYIDSNTWNRRIEQDKLNKKMSKKTNKYDL